MKASAPLPFDADFATAAYPLLGGPEHLTLDAMMTFEELSNRDAAFGDRIAQRERQLVALCLVPATLLIAAFLAPRSLEPVLFQSVVISIGLIALFTVLTSRQFFRDVAVRCPQCGRSVNGLLGTAEEGVEYGESMPNVLCCPRCQTEIATAT